MKQYERPEILADLHRGLSWWKRSAVCVLYGGNWPGRQLRIDVGT